ncbi:hypothetical protein SEUCBS139899_004216 [Sporothrix eucalyptigena]|uniref:Gluconokinase n=1 Tax=Sporothrix eucalyptigena TaxID=1812306 RepID=A0ABP0B0H2_9PEZI
MAVAESRSAHVVVVCGPAGSGKSTVSQHLATDLDYVYLEGDDFHTREAVDKMRNGEPLTDADRWDWLIRLREAVAKSLQKGALGVVLSCSALKKKYRDVLRVLAVRRPSHVALQFVYLHVPESLLLARVEARTNHYMKASMVQSQVASEEPPVATRPESWEDERQDTVVIEADGDLATVYASVRTAIGLQTLESCGPTPSAADAMQRPTQTSSTSS